MPKRIRLPRRFPDDAKAVGSLAVCERLTAAGHLALLVGGCVRDLLIDEPVADFDIATSATTAEVVAIFQKTVLVGEAFGVVRVVQGGDPPLVYEIAMLRSDGAYSDGRHPDSIAIGSAQEDAARRDFTINGMFLDPKTMEVIDHVGGLADLDRRVLRAIGDPRTRFTEDRLRLIRAVRFAARMGFAIEDATLTALVAEAPALGRVAGERIADELRKLFGARGRPALGARLLVTTGLLAAICERPDGEGSSASRVVDAETGERAARVEAQVDALALSGELATEMGWVAALLALVGYEEAGAGGGADALGSAVARLKLSRKEAARLEAIHLTLRGLISVDPLDLAPARRLMRAAAFAPALTLLQSDTDPRRAARGARWRAARAHCTDIDLWPPRLLAAEDVLALGVAFGRPLGAMLQLLEDAQLRGEIGDAESARAFVRARLAL